MTAIQEPPERAESSTRIRVHPTPANTFDLASLVQKHQAGVWRYVRFLGADTAEADDLTQETFLALARASSSNAMSGKRPVTCAWSPATNCWHCVASRTARSSTVELEAADSVWAAAAGPDGSLAGYLDALGDCLKQARRPGARGHRSALPRFREPRSNCQATRNATRRREDAPAPHATSAPRVRRTKIEKRNEPLTSAAV